MSTPLPEGLAEAATILRGIADLPSHDDCTHQGCAERRAARAALSALRDYAARVARLVDFAEIVRDCPPEALHLMPLAAQAALFAPSPETEENQDADPE